MSLPPAAPKPATVAVAFSGGRDSLALLHATVRSASALGLEVVALHVHHGLVAEADAWVASAIRLCARWQRRGWPLRLRWHRLEGAPARGDSIEAWARRERYGALARMATEEGARLVLLAQHRLDQAETVLLQALRGAGSRGLAAMPARIVRHGVTWARPWLDRPRSSIDAYIRRYRLQPIEDPSNADASFARNRLRLHVWPALNAAFGDAEQALAAAARRAAQADAALSELAAGDLAAIADAGMLDIGAWRALSAARQANCLRVWLDERLGGGTAETLVQRLLDELAPQRPGRWPARGDAQLVAYRGRLRVVAPDASAPAATLPVDLAEPGFVEVPAWHGGFEVSAVTEGGIARALLRRAELRPRSGGEQFQRAARTPPRSLKKQYQQAGIAPHERNAPLVWAGEQLLYVPGLGIDARAIAVPGTPQCTLRWLVHRSS